MNKILISNRGSSLVMVLVAVGIFSAITAALLVSQSQMLKTVNRVDGGYSLNSLDQAILVYTHSEMACKDTLGTQGPTINYSSITPNMVVPYSMVLPGIGPISAGSDLTASQLHVEKLELRDFKKLGFDISGNRYFSAGLFLTASLLKSSTGGQSLREKAVATLKFQQNSASVVTSCISSAPPPLTVAGTTTLGGATSSGGAPTATAATAPISQAGNGH